jgi:hypothetical protein
MTREAAQKSKKMGSIQKSEALFWCGSAARRSLRLTLIGSLQAVKGLEVQVLMYVAAGYL